MTTIAYRNDVLAADTLCTVDGMVGGYQPKIHRLGRLRIGGVGSVPYYESFRDWVAGGLKGDHPLKQNRGNCFIILLNSDAVCWCDDGPFRMKELFWALGSGEHLAMGAMRFGASAEEAVRVAMLHDTRTGGEVTVLA